MEDYLMNWNILSKYMQGRCSAKEMKQLQDWLKEDPANEDFFHSWVEASECEPQIDADEAYKAWKNLKKNHLKEKDKKYIPGLYGSDHMPAKTWWPASGQKWAMLSSAAVLVLLLTVAAVFLLQRSGHLRSTAAAKKITYRTIITKKGQQTKLLLKDGTKVMLNADSKLRIPKNYGFSKRNVYLQGEAFFNVFHNEKMPFTVHSGDLKIQDIGTAFDVLAYDSTRISIAVKEGEVAVGRIQADKTDSAHFFGNLTKNKVGRFGKKGTFSISTIQDISLFTGWTKGKFVFRNTPFPEVVRQLERRFNIKGKIVGSALKKRTLTATYGHLSLRQILNVLSISLHISYRRQHNTIIFKLKK
jgi:ferric-dicitrate binding protein FerR (iron transport regulator)